MYFGSLQWKSSVDTVDAAEFPPSTCCSDNCLLTQVKESRFDEGKSHATQPKHPERGSHGEHERHGRALERKGSETLRQWQSVVENPQAVSRWRCQVPHVRMATRSLSSQQANIQIASNSKFQKPEPGESPAGNLEGIETGPGNHDIVTLISQHGGISWNLLNECPLRNVPSQFPLVTR